MCIRDSDGTYRGQPISTSATVSVTIPESVVTQAMATETHVTGPSYAPVDGWATFQVTGVRNVADVSISCPQGDMIADPNTMQVVHGVWSVKAKFLTPGQHDVMFSYMGIPIASKKIFIGDINDIEFKFEPELQVNKTSRIYAVDRNTGANVNMTFTRDGLPITEITPQYGENITICMELMQKTRCESFQMELKEPLISIPSLTEGDNLTASMITITDPDTGETVSNYTILLDGVPLVGTWTADNGTHQLTILADNYKNITTALTIIPKQTEAKGQLPYQNFDILVWFGILALGVLIYWKARTSTVAPPAGVPRTGVSWDFGEEGVEEK